MLIWSYLQFLLIKKIAFQQLQGGLDNEFHLNLMCLEVYFSVLTQFLVVYVTSHPQKLLYANFSNIVERDIIV